MKVLCALGDVSKWVVSVSAQGLAFCGVMKIFWTAKSLGPAHEAPWRYKMQDLRRPKLNICFPWLYRIIRTAGNADLEWIKTGLVCVVISIKSPDCDIIIKIIPLADSALWRCDESFRWSQLSVTTSASPSPQVSWDTFPAACWHSWTYFNTLVKVLLAFL